MPITSYGIAHPEYLHIPSDGGTLYGCDQEWYKITWRRRAGCGPVAATNLLLYAAKKYSLQSLPYRNGTVSEAADAMNDVFPFVRPTIAGLNTVKLFVNGVRKLARHYGLRFSYSQMNIHTKAASRPSIRAVGDFIADGLRKDLPVAFLNLHAGDVTEVDSWHWVTIVGMREDKGAGASGGVGAGEEAGAGGMTGDGSGARSGAGDGASGVASCGTSAGPSCGAGGVAGGGVGAGAITIQFYDYSKPAEMDLGKWLATTRIGGGFAYFGNPMPGDA
jgi:hypothetical protein